MKFSDIIEELTLVWLSWMKYNSVAMDSSLDVLTRKIAVLECEKLIDKKYELMEKMDMFFNNEKI